MKFKKKPVEIEAWPARELVRAAGREWKALPPSVAEAYERGGWVFASDHISIPTLEGTMRAGIEDMVIRGVKGEFYPCKLDIFEATYDTVLDPIVPKHKDGLES